MSQFPSWINKRLSFGETAARTRRLVNELGLHTVCEAAQCPNLNECYERRFATFMILGDVCTRRCRFCSTRKGTPQPVDADEPYRISEAVRRLGLRHVVITSVTRDDLDDGGAAHFASTIRLLKQDRADLVVEVLIPDFRGREASFETVRGSGPDVVSHNVETVERLYRAMRPEADYAISLDVLRWFSSNAPSIQTKSGIMVGCGERVSEAMGTISDIRATGCAMLTIGQYLRPSPAQAAVAEFVEPEQFDRYRSFAFSIGFRHVKAGPFERSSYYAEDSYDRSTVADTCGRCS